MENTNKKIGDTSRSKKLRFLENKLRKMVRTELYNSGKKPKLLTEAPAPDEIWDRAQAQFGERLESVLISFFNKEKQRLDALQKNTHRLWMN